MSRLALEGGQKGVFGLFSEQFSDIFTLVSVNPMSPLSVSAVSVYPALVCAPFAIIYRHINTLSVFHSPLHFQFTIRLQVKLQATYMERSRHKNVSLSSYHGQKSSIQVSVLLPKTCSKRLL